MIIQAKAPITMMVASTLIARATSFGSRACSCACNGQTIAMMNSAKVSGAKTGRSNPQRGHHEYCSANADHRAECTITDPACSLDGIAHRLEALGG